MSLGLTIKGLVRTDPSAQLVKGTTCPERFTHEIYVHDGNMAFVFSGLALYYTYTVVIGFVEMYYRKPGQRVQDVLINNRLVLSRFDILGEVQPFTACEKTFYAEPGSGRLITVEFRRLVSGSCADISNIMLKSTGSWLDFVAGGKTAKLIRGGDVRKVPVKFDPARID